MNGQWIISVLIVGVVVWISGLEIIQPLTDVEVAVGENATFIADVEGAVAIIWRFNETYLYQLAYKVLQYINFGKDFHTLKILGRPNFNGIKIQYEARNESEQVDSEAYLYVETTDPCSFPAQPTDTPTSGGTDTGAGDSSSPTASGATDDPTEGSTGRPTEDPTSTTSDPTISDGTLAALIVSSVVVIGILTCSVILCVWKRQWIRRKIQPYLPCLQPSESKTPIQETTPPLVDGPAKNMQKIEGAVPVPASSPSPHDSGKVHLEQNSDSDFAWSGGKKQRRQSGPSVQLNRKGPTAEVEINDVAVSSSQVMPDASTPQSSSNPTEDRDDDPPTDEHKHPVSKGMEAVPCDGEELEGVMVV